MFYHYTYDFLPYVFFYINYSIKNLFITYHFDRVFSQKYFRQANDLIIFIHNYSLGKEYLIFAFVNIYIDTLNIFNR